MGISSGIHRVALSAFWLLAFSGDVAAFVQSDTVPVPSAIRAAYSAGTRSPDGRPGPSYWQLRPSYDLEARLRPEEAVVEGVGTISFLNSSGRALREVVLRLDQNRFRAAGSRPRTGGITILRLAVDGAEVPLQSPTVRGLATTVARIALSEPLARGDRTTIQAAWSYDVPIDEEGLSLRQGRWGHSVFQVAQWYPRVAMLDDLGGWDTAAHDGSVEFFNPFASFQVSVEVPAGWLVGATGVLQNPGAVLRSSYSLRLARATLEDSVTIVVEPGRAVDATHASESGLLVWSFQADSVSDFAWGASPEYGWAATSAALPGARHLAVHALFTPRHRESLLRAAAETASALDRLSGILTPYPWLSHTLLDGPEGGMEYPALTMSHGDRTLHEVGHQWFPMSVGSDETRFNFLDEGLASFLPAVIRREPVGAPTVTPALPEPILLPDDLRSVQPVLGYGRGARMLQALAADFGDAALLAALQAYASEWRFKHPSPWDFMANLERSLGAELDAFWLEWLFGAEAIRREF